MDNLIKLSVTRNHKIIVMVNRYLSNYLMTKKYTDDYNIANIVCGKDDIAFFFHNTKEMLKFRDEIIYQKELFSPN